MFLSLFLFTNASLRYLSSRNNEAFFYQGPVSLSISSTLATNPPANPSNITPVGQTGGQITVNQNGGAERKPQLEPTGSQAIDELLWEEMRLKFEFEELLNLKVLLLITCLGILNSIIKTQLCTYEIHFQILDM